MTQSPDVVIVVPAFNAGRTLAGVVSGVRRVLPAARVVCIDDGSADDTAAVAAAACDDVIRFTTNRGKGAALRAGFERALSLGATAVLTIDSDGQHDPACAPAMVASLAEADLVIGTRQRRRTHMPVRRRLSNALSSAAISWCAGCRLPDSQSGYRAIAARVIASVNPLGDRYEFETEFVIRAARAGFRIATVPVPTIYGAPSHFRELRDAARVVHTIWRLRPGTAH